MDKKQAIEDLSAKHAAEVKQMKADQEALLQKMNNSFDQQLAQKEQSHATAMQKLQQSHDAEVK